MSSKWVSVLLSAVGLVIAVIGLFLPWAEKSEIPGRLGGGIPVLGGSTIVGGFFSSIGVLVATVSWTLAMAKKSKSLLALAAGGGAWVMTCAWAWIVAPGTLFGGTVSSGFIYAASYGVYVSLAGGALSFVGAVLGFFQSSLPPISPVLSSLRKRRTGILLFAVGLAVGLVLGVVSVPVLFPAHTEPNWKSAVLVSGTTSQAQNGTIHIDSMDTAGTVDTETNITNGEYRVLLVGGLDYFFDIQPYGSQKIYEHILYVPSNVTAFTANF